MDQEFNFRGPETNAVLTCVGIFLATLLLSYFAVLRRRHAPVWGRLVSYLSIVIAIVQLIVVVVLPWSAKIRLSRESLEVRSLLYSTTVSLSDINLAQSKIYSSSDESPELATRKNGIGLPGFKAGWFTTANNTNAFVIQTSSDSILLIARKDSGAIIVTASEPTRLLNLLK